VNAAPDARRWKALALLYVAFFVVILDETRVTAEFGRVITSAQAPDEVT
jgi:hypothetical protein